MLERSADSHYLGSSLCSNAAADLSGEHALSPINLVLINDQMFVPGRRDNLASHSEGAARIYRYRGQRGIRDEFEGKLISTLRGPVVCFRLSPN